MDESPQTEQVENDVDNIFTEGAAQEGWKPWNNGNTKPGDVVGSLQVRIGEIVEIKHEAFIFLDPDGSIQWEWRGDFPLLHQASLRTVELESKCAFFRQGRQRNLLEVLGLYPAGQKQDGGGSEVKEKVNLAMARHELSARRFIAQGVATVFSGGTAEQVEAAFVNAEKFILLRGRETSLLWLYRMFGILALVSLGVLVTAMIFYACGKHACMQDGILCVAGMAAGGIGAYISRALASREQLPCDANAGKKLHYWEAILRWSVGTVAGGLLCLLIKSKVLLGSMAADTPGVALTLALALLAGLSERFLPTLLKRFDDQVTETPPPAGGGTGATPPVKPTVQKPAGG